MDGGVERKNGSAERRGNGIAIFSYLESEPVDGSQITWVGQIVKLAWRKEVSICLSPNIDNTVPTMYKLLVSCIGKSAT